MAQKKLKRFGEIKKFPNVLEYPADMPGNWKGFFKNNHEIILELACGKGEYTTGLATLFPQKNFIGVDIKGNRIWVGAKKAIENNLLNAAFLRIQIQQISQYFAANEVSEIWITFPDPQLRLSKANKRLTHPRMLSAYHQVLKKGGKIHLKTDSPDLYFFTKEVISIYQLHLHTDIDDVHAREIISRELLIKTHYESLDIAGSKTVFYLCFSLPENFSQNELLDNELTNILRRRNEEKENNFSMKSSAPIENEDFIFENGLMVFTKHYHLKRGYCCGNGCKNCPYHHTNVPNE